MSWSYDVEYIGNLPFTEQDAVYTCTVYAPGYTWMVILLTLIPQILIMFELQPALVKNYCYVAAITMGAEGGKDAAAAKKDGHGDGDGGGHGAGHGGGGHGGGGHGHSDHGHHHGHFDDEEFNHILELVFEKMAQDEASGNLFRTLINGALRRRASQRKKEDSCLLEGDEPDCTYDMYSAEVEIMFSELDSGGGDEAGDGELSYKELRMGLSKLFYDSGKPPLSKSKFRRLLRLVDRDRGGGVDEEELRDFLKEDHYQWPTATVTATLDDADTDGSEINNPPKVERK